MQKKPLRKNDPREKIQCQVQLPKERERRMEKCGEISSKAAAREQRDVMFCAYFFPVYFHVQGSQKVRIRQRSFQGMIKVRTFHRSCQIIKVFLS